ncbi:hypothetical protein GCM10010185_70050 [Saccharothrix coeruleofusca]|uniref:Uncharacterized protein n=1 Tax=Saccharothrix coeruleofusca TaxID=33919 RepID=A0A918ATM3_9PSEU|nr:hypothetical protein GCM10010185_70050 [Saccharothrix coeruleofusca]
MVAPVNPVALIRPTRLMVPAARMTSSTVALLLACGVALAGPLTARSRTSFVRWSEATNRGLPDDLGASHTY